MTDLKTHIQHMEMQTEPDQDAVYHEQGYDTEPVISPVQVSGEVRDKCADQAVYRTVTLNANNPFLLVLPQDNRRARATLVASTATVFLAENKDLAMAVNGGNTSAGAALPQGAAVLLYNRAQVWAVNSVPGTPATLTVIAERHSNEV